MSDTPQKATTKKSARTKALQDVFLEAFAQHGIISRACETAGIDRTSIYRWKEHDNDFLLRFNHALENVKDAIRDEIRRRAVDGWTEPLVSAGKYICDVRKYSDTLLIFHAKALMAEYRDKQQVEHSGSIDINGAKESLLNRMDALADVQSTHQP